MENKFYTTVDRILQFIENKGISKREFASRVGISHSLVGKANSIGSDKLEKIISAYPDINPVWLLTGIGDMYKKIDTSEMQGDFAEKLSPTESFYNTDADELVTENDISNSVLESSSITNLNEIDMDDEFKEHLISLKKERLSYWSSEEYISDKDKSSISFAWEIMDKRDVRTLYQLSVRIINNRISILKRDLMDLYKDYYLLITSINRFRLGYYSSKFGIPPIPSEQMKNFFNEFESEFQEIEDKKLKAVFLILGLEAEIESTRFSLHLTITHFSHASRYISMHHQPKLSDENSEENRS